MKTEKKQQKINKARAAFARLQRKLRTINERATVEIPKVNKQKPKILEKEERSFAGVKLKNGLNGENYVNGFRNPS